MSTREFFHDDFRLFLDHRVDWARYFRLRRGGDVIVADELDTFRQVLEMTGQVCADIEAGARDHWHEHARLEDGHVVTPPHIAAGYRKLADAGLVCMTLSPDYGGYGLPYLVNCAYLEMVSRADPSLMTIIGLQAGVAADIEKYGSEDIRRAYLPRFVSGELQGAMDLTEPQAGSDLGGIVTRAVRHGDQWRVTGEKIFITNGGAPVHLVLARDAATAEQSRGTTNGLNLILVPVTRPDGSPNGVRVTRVESKMGIHGSPTCVVEFDDAEGWLLGPVGGGFRAMLDLMNNARLGVAAQAIGIAEAAFRAALDYAGQRVQFGTPILHQPIVKSMLTLMAINIQAARALLNRTALMIDMVEATRTYLASPRSADDPERAALQAELERDSQLVRFFTPLCKYFATEVSNQVARAGIQLHGGTGFMAETAAGHYHSDSIITTIYEGTSEIQASFALKEMSKGALFATLEQLRGELDGLRTHHPDMVQELERGIQWIIDSTPALMVDPQYALLNAKRVSDMVVDVVAGAELLLQGQTNETKHLLARSFINRRILSVEMNARRIASGDASRIKRYDRILGLDAG